MYNQFPVPWLTKGSIEYIESFLKSRSRVDIFEYGCGDSTIWFSKFDNVNIMSVEHNGYYYDKTKKNLLPNKNFELFKQNRPYNNFINQNNTMYDLVLVDGRDRVMCCESSFSKVKENGILILDNSERPEYQSVFILLKDWELIEFTAIPGQKHIWFYAGWKTSVWINKK